MGITYYCLRFSTLLLSLLMPACGSEKQNTVEAQTPKLAIVNVLDPAFYQDAHIKGSINIPLSDLQTKTKDWDRGMKIIVYCSNYLCTASNQAVKMLTEQGFTDVSAYEGGVAEWHTKGYPIEGPARQGYLTLVGEKQPQPPQVKTIEAQELKQEIEGAEKAGLLAH